MNANDLPALEKRLAELSDALGGRAPTKGSLRVWLDALSECRFDDVQRALSDWPKTAIKPPVPADILKLCRSETSRRIEEEAKQNLATAITLDDVIQRADTDPEMVKRELAKIRAILSSPRPGPKDWAYKLKAAEEAGEKLDIQQSRLWREALREGV